MGMMEERGIQLACEIWIAMAWKSDGGANRFGMIVVRTGDWTTHALRRGETHSSSLTELPTH